MNTRRDIVLGRILAVMAILTMVAHRTGIPGGRCCAA
jgi:hypothetical protein